MEVSGTVAGEPLRWRRRTGNFQLLFFLKFSVQSLLLILLFHFPQKFLKRGGVNDLDLSLKIRFKCYYFFKIFLNRKQTQHICSLWLENGFTSVWIREKKFRKRKTSSLALVRIVWFESLVETVRFWCSLSSDLCCSCEGNETWLLPLLSSDSCCCCGDREVRTGYSMIRAFYWFFWVSGKKMCSWCSWNCSWLFLLLWIFDFDLDFCMKVKGLGFMIWLVAAATVSRE